MAPKREEPGPALLEIRWTILGDVPRAVSRFSGVAVARFPDYCSPFYIIPAKNLSIDEKGGSVWSTFVFPVKDADTPFSRVEHSTTYSRSELLDCFGSKSCW